MPTHICAKYHYPAKCNRTLATVGGPVFAAYVFDETSSYMFALWTFFAAYLLAAALVLATPPPRPAVAARG